MTRIERSFELWFPVKEVFAYLTDPANLVNWVTFLTHVHVTSQQKIGADTCMVCSLEVLGKNIQFDGMVAENEENKLFTWKSQKHSSFSMENQLEFSEKQGTTIINWTLDYTIKIPLLGGLSELAFLNYFRDQMDRSIERVKMEFRMRETISDKILNRQPHA